MKGIKVVEVNGNSIVRTISKTELERIFTEQLNKDLQTLKTNPGSIDTNTKYYELVDSFYAFGLTYGKPSKKLAKLGLEVMKLLESVNK